MNHSIKFSRTRLIQFAIITIFCGIQLIALSTSCLAYLDTPQFVIVGNNKYDTIKISTNKYGPRFVEIQPMSMSSAITEAWEVQTVERQIFHIRHKTWTTFWQVKPEQNEITHITKGQFGSVSTSGTPVKDVSIRNSRGGFKLEFRFTSVILNQPQNSIEFKYDNMLISNNTDWDVRWISSKICQFKLKKDAKQFFEFNAKNSTKLAVYSIDAGFGQLIKSSKAWYFLPIEFPNEAESNNSAPQIPPDKAIATSRIESATSTWLESEKNLFRNVLETEQYDTLIVPFQVSGYAVDRVARSLMTRTLINKIVETTNETSPSPTIILKALGNQQRTFDPFDVYQIANQIGAKKIIWCYTGHDLDLKLDVRFRIQEKDEAPFSNATASKIIEHLDMPFDDVRLPSLVFMDELSHIMTKLDYNSQTTPDRKNWPTPEEVDLPTDLFKLTKENNSSPIVKAYYLQLFGMLFPKQTIDKEQIFERSLTLLQNISPESPAYSVLKARALFQLHRRPAAVSALTSMSSAEEVYFIEYLNGNLEEAEQAAENIKSPLSRLLAAIELHDLADNYNTKSSYLHLIPLSIMQSPQHKLLIERRLSQSNEWDIQNNIKIKQLMDALFPNASITAENLAFNKMVVGQSIESINMQLAPYEHYRKTIEDAPDMILAGDNNGIIERDLLFLLSALGEANLLKEIKHGFTLGTPQHVLNSISELQYILDGHPEMTYLKGRALYNIASRKKKMEKEMIWKQVNKLWGNVFLWEQNQTRTAKRTGKKHYTHYDYDFPRRYYWPIDKNPEAAADRSFHDNLGFVKNGNILISAFDRKEIANLEISLDYSQTGFDILNSLYNKLTSIRYPDHAEAAIDKYETRFHGHPDRVAFMTKIYNSWGDLVAADKATTKAIKKHPLNWELYNDYARNLVKRGEIKKAVSIFNSYPPFNMTKAELAANNINRVGRSNNANSVGQYLLTHGWSDEARTFLELAANSNTGAGSQMRSRYKLAMQDAEYPAAARQTLTEANRYKNSRSYANYMGLLHVMGFHEEAWAVQTTLFNMKGGTSHYFPILVGMQMAGKSNDEQLQWLLKMDRTAFSSNLALHYGVRFLLTDRVIDESFTTDILLIRDWVSGKKRNSTNEQIPGMGPFQIMNSDPFQMVGDCLTKIYTGQHEAAYSLISQSSFIDSVKFIKYPFLIPYGVWAASNTGHTNDAEDFLERLLKDSGTSFDYYLAKAFLDGGKGQYDSSLKNLKLAHYNTLNTIRGYRLTPNRYQLLEACEWLYESTGQKAYKSLLLELADAFQDATPLSAWTYSFVAKHSDSDEERTRCLGITLYLDKQSSHISHISELEKKKALKWLKGNNPFIKILDETQNETIDL